MELPRFPNFAKLSLEHQEALTGRVARLEPYSDFNFTNLWVWDLEGMVEIAELNDNLVVRLFNHTGEYMVLSLDGTNMVDESLTALLENAAADSELSGHLEYVHQNVIDNIDDAGKFIIVEAPENFDYIYSAEALAGLSGSPYRRKRQAINQFKSAYHERFETKLLDAGDKNVQAEIMAVFSKWEQSRDKQRSETKDEFTALERFLAISRLVEAMIIGVYIDGVMEAYSVSEPIGHNYAVIHFEKANSGFFGLFDYIRQATAERLRQGGIEYINAEQDLGIEGLRNSKLNWHPVKLLKKYNLKSKN